MKYTLALTALALLFLCPAPGADAQTAVTAPEALADGVTAPKPLYTDPVNGAPTDPIIIRDRESGLWYMFYTSRRGNLKGGRGAEWVHGSPIGIATSEDLMHWTYLRDAEIGYAPDPDPTYWAPALVDDGQLYHMYLTYVPGIFSDWNHPRHIVHLTGTDLVHWTFESRLKLMSEKVIDADVARLDDGTWRMWYNDEPSGKAIAYADSPDLFNWEDHGLLEGVDRCEGPKAFRWKGSWWLICDEWKGLVVYRSDDAEHWTRQSGNILQTPGKGMFDDIKADHCDVVVRGDRAYIYYFTHLSFEAARANPETGRNNTFIQVAELKLAADGRTVTVDRDAGVSIKQ